MNDVVWLDNHIKHNGYKKPEEAKLFLKRELLRVSFIIPGNQKKLFDELKELIK